MRRQTVDSGHFAPRRRAEGPSAGAITREGAPRPQARAPPRALPRGRRPYEISGISRYMMANDQAVHTVKMATWIRQMG